MLHLELEVKKDKGKYHLSAAGESDDDFGFVAFFYRDFADDNLHRVAYALEMYLVEIKFAYNDKMTLKSVCIDDTVSSDDAEFILSKVKRKCK